MDAVSQAMTGYVPSVFTRLARLQQKAPTMEASALIGAKIAADLPSGANHRPARMGMFQSLIRVFDGEVIL